jgi:hypothetical protein
MRYRWESRRAEIIDFLLVYNKAGVRRAIEEAADNSGHADPASTE